MTRILFIFALTVGAIFPFQQTNAQALWNLNQKFSGTTSALDGNIQRLKYSPHAPNSSGALLNVQAIKDSSARLASFYSDSVVASGKYKKLDSSVTRSSYMKVAQAFLVKYKNVDSANKAATHYLNTIPTAGGSMAVQQKMIADSADSLHSRTVEPDSTMRADTLKTEKENWLLADEFAHNSQAQLKSFLDVFSTGDTAATNQFRDFHSNKPSIRNISYILLSLRDTSDIDNYFNWLKDLGGQSDDSADVQIKMNDIHATILKLTLKDSTHFSIFASGDFLNTIQSNPSGTNNNILSGSLGVNYRPNSSLALNARVILASTQDTVVDNYGSQLLAPAKGKGFGTGIVGINWVLPGSRNKTRTWALNVTAAASSQHWRLDSSKIYNLDTVNAKMDSTFTRAATIFGIDITAINAVAIKDSLPIGNAKYALSFGYNAGIAERILGGDVLDPLKNKASILYANHAYTDRFPTTRRFFFGLEAGTAITLGPVTTEFEMYYFPNSSKDLHPILGLTGLQVVFGASINLSLFSK
jgi:hypothetical protein